MSSDKWYKLLSVCSIPINLLIFYPSFHIAEKIVGEESLVLVKLFLASLVYLCIIFGTFFLVFLGPFLVIEKCFNSDMRREVVPLSPMYFFRGVWVPVTFYQKYKDVREELFQHHHKRLVRKIYPELFRYHHKHQFSRKIYEEMLPIAWHPDRVYDWCFDEEEKGFLEGMWRVASKS